MKITLLVSFLLCYSYCIYITQASPINCLEDQQSLLLQFKNNLTFDPKYSTTLKLWNNSTACCYWRGVRCDNEGHVIALYLIEEELISGGFNNSSSLFSLQHLQELYLSYTNFNSSIPSGFSKLEKLKELDLSNCHFYGTLSNSMSNLTHLTYLDLSQNDLSGAIPNSMSNLTRLTYLDLSHNDLSGAIPSSLFTLPSLEMISLEDNQFSKLDEFFNVSSSILKILDLSTNYLSGPFPISIFQLKSLSHLDLSFNKFNGSLHLDKFFELKNLNFLDISYNKLFLKGNPINVEPSLFRAIILRLASCNLKTFPSFLMNQSTLVFLDLSNNQIQGVLPNWIWKLQSLKKLNISHNLLTELEGPLTNLTYILIVDLHNNKLKGPIPVFLKYATYLDYSMNKFSSTIPQDIGNYVSFTNFISLSNNNFHGSIPSSLCQASRLQLLDLSFNNISGSIPSCLMTMTETLKVLNLRGNSLQGPIPYKFPASCSLQTLNLHGNLLHGSVPMSLAHCSKLEVLDIGTNQIVGQFPCFLQNIPTLKVLILRHNKFHGTLGCSKAKNPWKMIQIVDIAFNNFSGKLPKNYFRTLKKMKDDNDNVEPDIIRSAIYNVYYQDSVTLVSKGQQMELVKVLKIFIAIDFSSNHFEGQIPEDLMDLKALYVLNLSNNAFSNEIPSTIGSLKQLESLDLSNNSLVGEIPMQLASLSFLSYLNLSFNHLVGKIPTGTQLQSFQASSFEGNYGLYGPPLTEIPKRPYDPHPQPACGRLACSIDWSFLSVELGFVFGLGIIIGPVMLWKQWRVRYCKLVDKILCWMFSRMYLEYATDRGQTYTVLRW
ncbi:receptor like protein 22-like [Trifolium pratense]|uniref:receptor like protein 22-like n=1 Tax=Trifolium pratense TaxID=57577 RepID=UPI001E690BB2|nr:receptor like protein 22-like [Trifolium pratense]